MSDWGLQRVKRDWVPDWLWRVFCVGNLATFTPWKEILTAVAIEGKTDPGSVARGSLSMIEAEEMLATLARHYGERVAPVSDYCQGFYDWEKAIRDKLQRITDGDEADYEVERWNRIADAVSIVAMNVGKSSLLGRRIYGGERLRTEMCPEHKGQWHGLSFDNSPCGCDLTGWLKANSDE